MAARPMNDHVIRGKGVAFLAERLFTHNFTEIRVHGTSFTIAFRGALLSLTPFAFASEAFLSTMPFAAAHCAPHRFAHFAGAPALEAS